MDKDSALFPSVPANTVQAARALYGRGNVYLRLGDRLNHLVSKFDQRILAAKLGRDQGLLLGLLTIIQYVEKLTDTELAASIQHRMDLRYALHLATPSPRLNPDALCAFRRYLLSDPQSWRLFEELFHSVYPEITPNATKEEPAIDKVLNSICENEVRMCLLEAMLHCMEALSANHFSWLRQIALPHWYQRYNRSIVVNSSNPSLGRQELTREDIQGDIQHLLYAVQESHLQDIMEVREIQDLSLTWQHLTNTASIPDCDHCTKRNH